MGIAFGKIRWKNLLSTGNAFTELDLSTQGTTLIVGENGAGKSTILDALTFALFGKPFRNINKPQLINSITNRDALVELEFMIGRNHYMIRRGLKPNVFEVFCNDVLLNQEAEMRDYQELLERKILKTNYKSFCQVVVLGSASFVPFMQLPAGQRRSIIEDLLDLQVFTVMNTLLKSRVQENQDQIFQNSTDQKLVSEKIKMLKAHLNEVRSKSEQFIREKTVTLESLESKVTEILNAKRTLREQADSLNTDAGQVTALKSKLEKMRALRAQMEAKTSILVKDIKFFTDHDSCPTCRQNIDREFSCQIVSQRETETKEIEAGLQKLAEKHEQLHAELNELLALDKKYDEIITQISHETLRARMYEDQIKSIQKEIEDAQRDKDETSDVKVADLETQLNGLTSLYNELQDDRQVLAAAAAMLKDGGIKTKIVNQYVPIINKLINKYLSEFDLFVEFHLDEQFNETIKSRHRDEFSYASFSEGEKQKIDLAILFTWRAVAKLRNSLNTNLLILDEVFDSSLDGNAADDLLKILQALSKDANVFIISHRDNLHDKFTNTIRFVKHKNFSRLEEVQ
jgi:DNA repair exonuclease SbcCD ATPase subunit